MQVPDPISRGAFPSMHTESAEIRESLAVGSRVGTAELDGWDGMGWDRTGHERVTVWASRVCTYIELKGGKGDGIARYCWPSLFINPRTPFIPTHSFILKKQENHSVAYPPDRKCAIGVFNQA